MGVSLEVWRRRIGCHHQPGPCSSNRGAADAANFPPSSFSVGPGLRIYLAIVIVAAIPFLYLSGDVELNPGPPVAETTPLLTDELLQSLKNGTCISVNLPHALKNKHILQLYTLREASPTTTWTVTEDWLRLILQSLPTGETDWSHKIRLNWTKLHGKNRDLRKNIGRADGKDRLAEWLEEPYKLPVFKGPRKSSTSTKCVTDFDLKVVEAANEKLRNQKKIT